MKHAPQWERARDASSGQDAVHAKGDAYLPKLADQTNNDYDAYKQRASYFNATGRTVDGLVGMVFRKDIQIEQSGIDGLIKDVDLSGNSLDSLAQTVLREVITVSRYGLLVEYPQVTEAPKTKADQLKSNLRPYVSKYPTESIINWKVERVNNAMQFTLIVLAEKVSAKDDEYEPKMIDQIRELRLDGGVYLQRIWQKPEKKSKYEQIGSDIIPFIKNKPLSFIPFYPFGSDENSLTITESPILSLADLNLAHYRVNADYEHGCHFTGLPMLFFKGIDDADDKGNKQNIHLGSQTAVVAPNPEADGKFIEFTGLGLGALEKNLESKEKQMAAIGARMLEQQKNGVEAAETKKITSNGESSVLAAISKLTSAQLSKMLTFMAEWAGSNGEVIVNLNTDYMPAEMSAQELTAWVAARQSGSISQQTFFNALKRGEAYESGTTFEEEQELISQEEPDLAVE